MRQVLGYLLENILHFTRLLGALGLDVPAARALDVVQALEHIEVGQRTDFYHTLRCLLVHRPQEVPVFDEAFRVFWRRPPEDWTTRDLRALGERHRSGAPQVEAPASHSPGEDEPEGRRLSVHTDQVAALTYSAREVLHTKDFARFTAEELDQAKRMMATLEWDLGVRHTRRWKTGRGTVPDFRRVIRANLKHGAEIVTLPTRRRKTRRRPIVLLCDVSGSMERYTRMLLHFVCRIADDLNRVEVFLFATRLTRITRHLATGSVDEVVSHIPAHVPDFSGGTRIGETLGVFNRRWARRVLGHGAVVLLISDGWDRGDPRMLGAEIARLQRTAHRLIWLNPLLGSPDYAPLTRGMQAALAFVDDFLPVHNLVSLQALAVHLNSLPARRPARGRHMPEQRRS